MEPAFEQVLIDALDALEAGEDVSAILARYPEHEAELRPVLLTATSLADLRIAHSLEAQAASRQRFLDYAAASALTPNRGSSLVLLLRRLSLAMAALLIVLALLGTSVLFGSSEAVPGDALYEAKRFFEDTRYSLTGDSTAREELQNLFEETRVREIKTLLRMNRSEEVEFTGAIEAVNGDTWLVAGIEVMVLDSTTITGADDPAVGYLVQISGVTADGRVDARAIVVRRIGSLPEPTPEPNSIETPPAEPSPTHTATPTPTATQTPTPTTTVEESTPELSPPSNSTPTPGSPENSNGNDNEVPGGGNENEGASNGNEGSGENEGNENGEGNDNDNDNDDHGNENSGSNHNDNDNDNDDDEERENDNNANENRNDNENRNENHS